MRPRAFEIDETFPAILRWDRQFAIMRRLAVFVGHFQEQQVSKLFQIVAVAHAVVAEGIAERPDFGNDGGGIFGIGHCFRYLLSSLTN